MQKYKGLDINRVHLHPYGSFLICYDKLKWEDARNAIVKSAMAVPKYCQAGPKPYDIKDSDIDNFDISGIPQSFNHPNVPG